MNNLWSSLSNRERQR